MEKISLLGFKINRGDYGRLLELIDNTIRQNASIHIVTANAAILVEASRDPELKECILKGDIITADGMSLVWAASLLGVPLKERITGIDLTEKILQRAQSKGYKIYFLGAKQEIIEKAIAIFHSAYPNLKISGFHNGYFKDLGQIMVEIKRCHPDILLVGMGFGLQEKIIYKIKNHLKLPVMIGVGGSFDVIAGRIKRAPIFMQKLGMEWFFRLIQEPGRLWKRYLIGNIVFISLVARELWLRFAKHR